MKFISVSLLIVILTWLCGWLDPLRPSFEWRMSGGCRVHAGTPWQWLFKEGVSCSPASPWGTGFFLLCLERPTGSCSGAMTGFFTYPLSAVFLNYLFFLGGGNKWRFGAAQHLGCPRCVVCGVWAITGEMGGCHTSEEAPEPICGSLWNYFNSSSGWGF